MKHSLFALLLILSAQSLYSQTSIYGGSGYTFTPTSFIGEQGKYGGQFSHDLKHFSVYGTLLDKRLEWGLSNTYGMVSAPGYGPQKFPVPIIPSLRYSIARKKTAGFDMGYSVGATFPYGVYVSGTARYPRPLITPELTGGFSFRPVDRFYALGGFRLILSDFSGNPLPLSFTGDAGWASSTEVLSEIEEGFYSLGMQLQISQNIAFNLDFRKDPNIYLVIDKNNLDNRREKESQNTKGTLFIRISYHFDGFKVLPTKGVQK